MARNLCRLVTAVLVCLALPAVASASSVTPVYVSGNPQCSDYGLAGLKVDSSNVAGDYSNQDLSVHVEQDGNGGDITSWSSNIGIDKVIVKGGAGRAGGGDAGSNVYSYDPEATSDSGLAPPNNTGLSHVEFCYDTGDNPPPPPTCAEAHAGEADSDGDGIVDACDETPNPPPPPGDSGSGDTGSQSPEGQNGSVPPPSDTGAQAPAGDSGEAPATMTDDEGEQFVLGERVSSPTARLLAATGCVTSSFSARVRGTQVKRVVFRLDGKKIGTVTKRNKAGFYALRISPAKLRVGVHRLTATVTFNATTRTQARTLRASFQRCGNRLIAPRFTG